MVEAAAQVQTDILEVIADLSNDEVFTPPKLAKQVLDLLPPEVWSNPELTFLDPGAKTGVFLREITRRLMDGLASTIPDETERLEHVLRKMVWGVAITELTSLMSRRTLYCSKNASGEHSIVRFEDGSGNVWYNRVEHTFVNGRCKECSASAEIDREGRDNYAYGFIHTNGREQLKKVVPMKFDVIVGNPPYQMEGGGGGTNATPLYNVFVEQAKALNPSYVAMIIPSRWMAGGRGLDDFRKSMLEDGKLRALVDYPNAQEIFPSVDIKGGVCYFLWQSNYSGECAVTQIREGQKQGPVNRNLSEFDVFVRDSRALEILKKVLAKNDDSVVDLISGDTPFGLASNFRSYRSEVDKKPEDIRIYANVSGKRIEGFIHPNEITKNVRLIDEWKVLLPEAGSDGGKKLPDVVLGTPLIATPPSVCTQTYLAMGPFGSEEQALSAESYVRTRFFRFLVSLRKISQHALRSTYTWVPIQSWDRTWTDEELSAKYSLTESDQEYIAYMIKDMQA